MNTFSELENVLKKTTNFDILLKNDLTELN